MPRPIVIIHGWSDSSAGFTALRNYVASLDLGTPIVINLADYVSMDDAVRFDDLVAGMQRAWLKEGLPTAARSVDAIVHSTGGLVIRDWLDTHFAPDTSPVHRLLMLAPANFGSPLAHKGHSFIGRVIKGFKADKPFQTGLRLLKGLELASPYAWQLAERDRFGTDTRYGPGRVLCTVLVGNVGYSGISAAANEDGSDGTVRASTANMNCARFSIDFSQDPQNPAVSPVHGSSGRTAFRILDGDNHSTAAMKDRGPKDPAGRRLIADALRVTDATFLAWCDACDQETLAITTAAETDYAANKDSRERLGYQNTVVRVMDDAGAPVGDYFLEFYLDDKDDPKDRFAAFFHRDVIRTVHAHGDSPSYRSLLIDCSVLYHRIDGEKNTVNLSLSASPDIRINGNVGYRTLSSADIGALRLSPQKLRHVFVPHRTLLVDIKLRRERGDGVFRIKSA
jgi:hypothetical protein